MICFVDTNVLLRFLTRDEEIQYQACRRLLKKAEVGKVKLTTSDLVLFEVIWTLLSFYRESKDSVVEKMISFLSFPNFEIEHKDIFLEAMVIWQQQNVDFNDTFNYVWAQNQKVSAIYSYDKHFDKLQQIPRKEP